MDAMNVTDVFKIETQAKLAASDDYHKTALDCGLVQFREVALESPEGGLFGKDA